MRESDMPTTVSSGFQALPHSAQALWFHLAVQADREGCLSALSAKHIREKIRATDEDVRTLMRNKFIYTDADGRIHVAQLRTYPGLVVEDGEEPELVILFQGMELCRQTLRDYYRQQSEAEKRRQGRY